MTPFPFKPDAGTPCCGKCGALGVYVTTIKAPLGFCDECGEYAPVGRTA